MIAALDLTQFMKQWGDYTKRTGMDHIVHKVKYK